MAKTHGGVVISMSGSAPSRRFASDQISETGARTEPVRLGHGAIRSLGVQASSGRDRRQSSPSVAIQIELAAPARRALLRVACHDGLAVPFCRSRVPRRNKQGENPSDQSNRTRQSRGWSNASRTSLTIPVVKTGSPRLASRVSPSSVASTLVERSRAAEPARHRLSSYRIVGVQRKRPKTYPSGSQVYVLT
jgi:hypothetical protein